MTEPRTPDGPTCSCCGRRVSPLAADRRCGFCGANRSSRDHVGDEPCNIGRSTYTPDPADVLTAEIMTVVDDAYDAAWKLGASHADALGASMHALVAALAGRLLPADAETRTEWGVRLTWKDGRADDQPRETRASAENMFAYHDSRSRQQPDLWAVVPTLIQRTVSRAVGPWLPTPTEES